MSRVPKKKHFLHGQEIAQNTWVGLFGVLFVCFLTKAAEQHGL